MQTAVSARASLIALLSAPPGFLNVTDALRDGFYLLGHDDFRVKPVRVASIFQRSFAGHYEDFILGVLSVLIIAVLSELVQTVLMRTRRAQVAPAGLHAAFVLDEIRHFRNVWEILTRYRASPRARRIATNSLLIGSVGLGLLAFEVLAVFLTQPLRVYTAEYMYNLRGLQPAGTSIELARQIDRLSSKKRCVTPSMKDSNQSREYSISACVMRTYERNMDQLDDTADFVEVGSWFHKAGSNHVVTFGNKTMTGKHSIETRATIMLPTLGITKGLLFEVQDTPNMTYARYLQMYMIYSSIGWNCEQGFETRSCRAMVSELETERQEYETRPIVLWQQGEDDVVEDVTGVVTRFRIEMRRPFMAVQEGLSVLSTSAVIREVEGSGMYVSMDASGRMEDDIPRLVSEEGRVAGVFLLVCIFWGLFIILVILRSLFRPMSLARIARSTIVQEIEATDEFVGAGPRSLGVRTNCEPSQPRRPPRTARTPFDEDEYVSAATIGVDFD